MKESINKTIANKNFCFTPIEDGSGLYALQLNGKNRVKIGGTKVNGFQEDMEIAQKWRLHRKIDALSAEIEMETLIPFGTEPFVRRNITVFDGVVQLTLDVQGGNGGVVNSLEIDDVTLCGDWCEVAVLNNLSDLENFDQVKWVKTGTEKTVFYDNSQPFLLMLAKDSDGRIFEVGCGDDYWRWQLAAQGASQGAFSVSGTKENIQIKRLPVNLVLEKDEKPESRSWRFKWYLAWSNPQESLNKSDVTAKLIDVCTLKLPESALSKDENGAMKHGPCLMAAPSRRFLRKLIRTSDESLILTNLSNGSCFDAAHLERPKKNILAHWDINDRFELYLWGNRKMSERNTTLRLRSCSDNEQKNMASWQVVDRKICGELEIF